MSLTQREIDNNRGDIIMMLRERVRRDGIENLIDYMDKEGFFVGPSSTKYHQAYEGGNAKHSLNVTNILFCEVNTLPEDIRPSGESIILVGLLHDICKIDQYARYNSGEYYRRNDVDNRHAKKSIDIIKQFIELTEEEELAIRYHMGIYETPDYDLVKGDDRDETFENYSNELHKIWNDFGKAIDKYPLVYLLHVADMRDTHNAPVREGSF